MISRDQYVVQSSPAQKSARRLRLKQLERAIYPEITFSNNLAPT